MNSTECASCHAPVVWCEKFPLELNDSGLPKTVPVDLASIGAPDGRIEVWPLELATHGGTVLTVHRARYLNRQHPEPDPGHQRGTSHFATCPQAGQWRSKTTPGRRAHGRAD